MKAFYDKEDSDYYVFFEKGERDTLLQNEEIECPLYSMSSGGIQRIMHSRHILRVSPLETYIDVFRKTQELTQENISYGYADILVVYGDYELNTPYILFLSKEWITVGLSTEFLDRCGKNEQRYAHGRKIHFYSEDSTHSTTKQMKAVFEMNEAQWQREYG